MSDNGFIIQRTETGFRVCRSDDRSIHTHLRNIKASKELIDNVADEKIPRRVGNYYISSLSRLTNSLEYKKKVDELLDVRKRKSQQRYFNPHRKSF